MQLHRLLPAKPSSTAVPAFYRLRDVTRICALSKSTIYRRIAEAEAVKRVWENEALSKLPHRPEVYLT